MSRYQAFDDEEKASLLNEKRITSSSRGTSFYFSVVSVIIALVAMFQLYHLNQSFNQLQTLTLSLTTQLGKLQTPQAAFSAPAQFPSQAQFPSHNRNDPATIIQRSNSEVTKLGVPHVTPFQDQFRRGTCWDFATIGILEQSYRQQGVLNGWLNENEWVDFSEQAYGAVVLQACQKHQHFCLIPHDAVWMNSTDGGEIPLIYYLPELNTSVLPGAVCPYVRDGSPANDMACPGMKEAIAHNPVQFSIKTMETYYDITSIKNALIKHQMALGISTMIAKVRYFYPCTGEWASHPDCQLPHDKCHLCPFDKFPPGTCCVSLTRPSVNMEGEFYSHGKTDFALGGHAMVLVGFNDDFVTTTGFKGGFILKNSWGNEHTGGPRGSHSMGYYLQQHSHWDELMVCPNSRNPRNWYPCSTLSQCLSSITALFSEISGQPDKLACLDRKYCDTNNDRFVYFIKNYTMGVGDDMVNMCFFKVEKHTNDSADFCLGPFVLDQYAEMFQPVNLKPDDHDLCGFYFFPYELFNTWWGRFQDGFVTYLDIEWHPRSYLANKKYFSNSGLDYSLLEKSTYTQNSYDFPGPFPYEPYLNVGKDNLRPQVRN